MTVTNESDYYYYCIHYILFVVDAMMTVGRVIVQFLRSSTMALPAAYCVKYTPIVSECVCVRVCAVCVSDEK